MWSRVQLTSFYPIWDLLSSSSKTPSCTSVARTRMMRCHYIIACILVATNINQWWTADCVSKDHEQPQLQDDVLSHWRWSFHASTNEVPSSTIKMAGKQRRTTLHHAIGRKRPSRKNSSLHLQWTSICRPGTNENQERLPKRNMQLPHPHLLDRMVQRKVKCKGEV